MNEESQKRPPMTDSGLGSFGSESDTSPGGSLIKTPQSLTSNSPIETADSSNSVTEIHSKDRNVSAKPEKRFSVIYFGNIEIDKRYVQAQFWKVILQWIVAEIKKKSYIENKINIEVSDGALRGFKSDDGESIFEHDLYHLSKFSRTHLDTSCFAYVTKKSDYSFICHVYKTEHENVVKEIFTTVRDATKTGAKENVFQNVTKNIVDGHASEQHHDHLSLFEVLYVGKVVVSSKRTQPTFIDDAVEKFKVYEEQKEQEIADRKRRTSGQSVQSLPGNLEKTVNIKENELKISARDDCHNKSNDSVSSASSDQNISVSSSDTLPQDSEGTQFALSSTKTKPTHLSTSDESIESLQHSKRNGDSQEDSKQPIRPIGNLQRTVLENQTYGKKNRTMLLQISNSEVSLISPDRKRTSLKRQFKDISFCSQGIRFPEYFGFITRDTEAAAFVCYVFMCAAESVVEDVMQTLKAAFEAAFQQSAKTHMCELCPMHQLLKVAEEIDRLPWEQMIDILTRRVEQLTEADQEEFQQNLKAEDAHTEQEVAEASMMVLRYMCEHRQLDHVHLSDANKNLVNKYEFTLSESARNQFSAFHDLRARAKKSLTDSFETIKEKVRHRSGEALNKNRSQSMDSDSGDTDSSRANDLKSPTSMFRGFFSPTSPTNIPADHVPVIKSPPPLSGDLDSRPRSSTNPGLLQKMRERHRSIPENDDNAPAPSFFRLGFSAKSPPPEQPKPHEQEMLTIDKIQEGLKTTSLKDNDRIEQEAKGERDRQEKEENGKEDDKFDEVVEEKVKADVQRFDSPLRTMFIKAGNKNPMQTPSPLSSGSVKTPNSAKPPLKRAGSWRLNILNKVVTPAKIPTRSQSARSASVTSDEDPLPPSLTGKALDRKISSQRCRMLWKKAILETLLFIRMKKEMKSLQTRHEETASASTSPHNKLDYEEITPCLKQVTKIWTEMLCTPQRKSHKFDYRSVEQAVKDGVPRTKRGDIWQFLVEQHKVHHSTIHNLPEIHKNYEDLLKQLTTHQHAILIDLGRTFPTHPYFSTQLGAGQLSLFNILKAYSLLDKEVGYCQGLSFIAGVLLMHMSEGVAFDVMRYMMFAMGFRRQYRPDMIALQIQMYQLSRLLHDYHRDLYDHFELHEIAPTLYAAPWFLTMFASQFPLGFVARVFDVIFLQGSVDVVLKVALVVLANHKELIKNCTSFESIVKFLKTDLPEMGIIQMERVVNQVFALDISKQLHAYEVEYHVLQEEMVTTPQRGEGDVVSKLEDANHKLKKQNLELLEQLQTAHSHHHSLDVQINKLHTSNSKLKKHIRTLEIERAALLSTMARIQSAVPSEILQGAGIEIPSIPRNMTITHSPIHSPIAAPTESNSMSALDNEVAILMGDMKSTSKSLFSSAIDSRTAHRQKHLAPPRIRRPSSSEH